MSVGREMGTRAGEGGNEACAGWVPGKLALRELFRAAVLDTRQNQRPNSFIFKHRWALAAAAAAAAAASCTL